MAISTNVLSPEYLSIDYSTLRTKLQDEIKESGVFRDINYEGSNILTLIELQAYIGELTTFLTNKIAKNVYIDTADIYETVHRLASLIGYDPRGYVSAETVLTITLTGGYSAGDQIYIPAWAEFATGSSTTYNNETIKFCTVDSHTQTIPTTASTSSYSFSITAVQGEASSLVYTGEDILDNTIILPFSNYAHNNNLDDVDNPVKVYVGSTPWTRVSDFYDNLTETSSVNTVFKLEYDKYQRYKIVFSSTRSVPDPTDTITVYLLESLGANGAVGAGLITDATNVTVSNLTAGTTVDSDLVAVSNASATVNSSDPELIDTVKENAKAGLRSQYRNVTATDYIAHLEERADVDTANAWGEQDIAPSGSVAEYNKVYVSVVPNTWSGTINTSAGVVWSGSTSAAATIPISYDSSYQSTLETYLEPRKMISAYEVFQVPDIVYFFFDIGIRVKRNFSYADVSEDVKNKLIYYFRYSNQDFASTVNFLDIYDYILDTSYQSTTNTFANISGIKNLIIRDVGCSKTIYEPNTVGNFPKYGRVTYTGDNRLRSVVLDNDQFPALLSTLCTFTEET